MKNILCLCDYGEHRSVIMASILRGRGHFAVAGSFDNWKELPTGSDFIHKWDLVIQMQEGGKHFIGRDMPEVTDYEWTDKCRELIKKLGL